MDWLIHYAVPLVGVIGAALYGVLRLAYVFFYLRLRASPDEVGYGYSQVLADELIGAIELVLLVAVCLVPLGAITMLSLGLVRNIILKSPENRLKIKGADLLVGARKLGLWCIAAAIPLVLVGLPVLGWLEGEAAANGYTVRNVYLTHFITLPVLAVEAVPAKVTWIMNSGSGEAGVGARQCLLYLGQANDVAVFYDVQSAESIRLPVSDVIIILQDTTSVPIGC